MPLNIDCEIAELRQLTVTQLRARHRELCGQPTGSPHKEHLVRRIAWWPTSGPWASIQRT